MSVQAKHKITGKIMLVTDGQFKVDDNLIRATGNDLKAFKEESQLRVFGRKDVATRNTSPNPSWTKKQLIAYCQNKKIEVDDSFTKAELLRALQERD